MFKRIGFSTLVMVLSFSILSISTTAFAETIKVGLEPFPPLIVDDKSGYTIDILKKIEENSDLKFEITIMPYIRAKKTLESGKIDMIAHTPYQVEVKEFYTYAQELDFIIETANDIYVTDKKKLGEDIKKLNIGIPRGNEDFASELLGVPVANFYLGELDNLLKMLSAGRIDAFWFERASTMLTLQKLKIKNIHYMKIPEKSVSAGIAVRKDDKGTALKKKIDSLIKDIDIKEILKGYDNYLSLPDSGIVKIN